MEREAAIKRLKCLKGKDLHQLAIKYGVTVHRNGKANKGWAGHVLERFLGLPINSAQSPNFGSWELKSIPLKTLKNGKLSFKETMAITMIDPVNVCQKEFEDSHLYAKLQKAVIVARTVGQSVDDPSYIHSITQFNLSDELYFHVKSDYDLVRAVLLDKDKGLQALTGKMGVYIQPRTKGAGHGVNIKGILCAQKVPKSVYRLIIATVCVCGSLARKKNSHALMQQVNTLILTLF